MHRLASCAVTAVAMLMVLGSGQAWARARPHSGASDLSGLWSNASITSLERPAAFRELMIPDAEAAAFEAAHPGMPDQARGGPVGQEDTEWWEMGGKLARIRGRARSSWIVDPPDGRLPYSEAGLTALRLRQAQARSFDSPELRPAAERCLMGILGSSLPPMMNPGYNTQLQIVQTRDHLVILPEMNVGPRIIPLHPTAAEPGLSWNGRSQGRWRGPTVVVETTGFHPDAQWRAPAGLFISSGGKVTERFTRTGPDEILYAFEVDDPATYTRKWRAEMPLRRSVGPMYEFACHEGNYSLPGILAGGREEEKAATATR